MYRNLPSIFILIPATIALAADPTWMTKDIANWTQQDATRVLTDSPWVKKASVGVLPGMSPSARREGGDMNGEGGGRDGLGFDPSLVGSVGSLLTGINAPAPRKPPAIPKLDVRWESALPVRSAEIKANAPGAPELDGEDYAIAIYAVPLKVARADMKGLPQMLKKVAMLKIENKKDIKPSRVSVVELGDDLANIIYFFPRSARLSLADKRIEFDAQIVRVVVAQYFYPAEMVYQGRLEL
jgi:hypothetical protein